MSKAIWSFLDGAILLDSVEAVVKDGHEFTVFLKSGETIDLPPHEGRDLLDTWKRWSSCVLSS